MADLRRTGSGCGSEPEPDRSADGRRGEEEGRVGMAAPSRDAAEEDRDGAEPAEFSGPEATGKASPPGSDSGSDSGSFSSKDGGASKRSNVRSGSDRSANGKEGLADRTSRDPPPTPAPGSVGSRASSASGRSDRSKQGAGASVASRASSSSRKSDASGRSSGPFQSVRKDPDADSAASSERSSKLAPDSSWVRPSDISRKQHVVESSSGSYRSFNSAPARMGRRFQYKIVDYGLESIAETATDAVAEFLQAALEAKGSTATEEESAAAEEGAESKEERDEREEQKEAEEEVGSTAAGILNLLPSKSAVAAPRAKDETEGSASNDGRDDSKPTSAKSESLPCQESHGKDAGANGDASSEDSPSPKGSDKLLNRIRATFSATSAPSEGSVEMIDEGTQTSRSAKSTEADSDGSERGSKDSAQESGGELRDSPPPPLPIRVSRPWARGFRTEKLNPISEDQDETSSHAASRASRESPPRAGPPMANFKRADTTCSADPTEEGSTRSAPRSVELASKYSASHRDDDREDAPARRFSAADSYDHRAPHPFDLDLAAGRSPSLRPDRVPADAVSALSSRSIRSRLMRQFQFSFLDDFEPVVEVGHEEVERDWDLGADADMDDEEGEEGRREDEIRGKSRREGRTKGTRRGGREGGEGRAGRGETGAKGGAAVRVEDDRAASEAAWGYPLFFRCFACGDETTMTKTAKSSIFSGETSEGGEYEANCKREDEGDYLFDVDDADDPRRPRTGARYDRDPRARYDERRNRYDPDDVDEGREGQAHKGKKTGVILWRLKKAVKGGHKGVDKRVDAGDGKAIDKAIDEGRGRPGGKDYAAKAQGREKKVRGGGGRRPRDANEPREPTKAGPPKKHAGGGALTALKRGLTTRANKNGGARPPRDRDPGRWTSPVRERRTDRPTRRDATGDAGGANGAGRWHHRTPPPAPPRQHWETRRMNPPGQRTTARRR